MPTYTKQVTLNHQNEETLAAHIDHPAYLEWYADQADQNLVDKFREWLPYIWSDELTAQVLVSDQSQADSLIDMITNLGNEIGYLLLLTVSDFDENTGNINEFLAYVDVKNSK